MISISVGSAVPGIRIGRASIPGALGVNGYVLDADPGIEARLKPIDGGIRLEVVAPAELAGTHDFANADLTAGQPRWITPPEAVEGPPGRWTIDGAGLHLEPEDDRASVLVQWQRNGRDIPDAVGTFYTLDPRMDDGNSIGWVARLVNGSTPPGGGPKTSGIVQAPTLYPGTPYVFTRGFHSTHAPTPTPPRVSGLVVMTTHQVQSETGLNRTILDTSRERTNGWFMLRFLAARQDPTVWVPCVGADGTRHTSNLSVDVGPLRAGDVMTTILACDGTIGRMQMAVSLNGGPLQERVSVERMGDPGTEIAMDQATWKLGSSDYYNGFRDETFYKVALWTPSVVPDLTDSDTAFAFTDPLGHPKPNASFEHLLGGAQPVFDHDGPAADLNAGLHRGTQGAWTRKNSILATEPM